jgi:hypothetical protein
VDDGIRVLASLQMLFAQLLLLFGFYEIMRGSRAGGPDAAAGGGGGTSAHPATASPPAGARPGAAGD